MVFSLWKAFKNPEPSIFSTAKDLIFHGTKEELHKANEKTIFGRFESFLQIKLIDKGDQRWCQPGELVTPEQLRLFLVQSGWESYHGIPSERR